MKDEEAKKPETQRREVRIIGDKVVRAGQVIEPEITTPQPYELFTSVEEQWKINGMAQRIKEAQPIHERNSTFVGLAVNAHSIDEIRLAYKAVMQRFPFMDHVMLGYQVNVQDKLQHGSCDDTEYGGGVVIDKHLYASKLCNLAVFVVRRYGGIHMGFDRFRIIQRATDAAVAMLRPEKTN